MSRIPTGIFRAIEPVESTIFQRLCPVTVERELGLVSREHGIRGCAFLMEVTRIAGTTIYMSISLVDVINIVCGAGTSLKAGATQEHGS